LSPLFRSTIGFDRIFDLLENARGTDFDTWPPYDIARTAEDSYRITMAVAGFSESELSITHEPNLLVIAGSKLDDDSADYLHRGIPGRSFERRFELADHVKVANAELVNGLLTVTLVREVPEEMKPRRITIRAGEPVGETNRVEGKKQAA
jgi:molecular chaperone IbpA